MHRRSTFHRPPADSALCPPMCVPHRLSALFLFCHCSCIMSELYTFRPLFPGSSEPDTLQKICAVLGSPSALPPPHCSSAAQHWPEGVKLAAAMRFTFPQFKSTPLKQLVPNANSDALSLLAALLTFDPKKRPTALQALQHPYFAVGPQLNIGLGAEAAAADADAAADGDEDETKADAQWNSSSSGAAGAKAATAVGGSASLFPSSSSSPASTTAASTADSSTVPSEFGGHLLTLSLTDAPRGVHTFQTDSISGGRENSAATIHSRYFPAQPSQTQLQPQLYQQQHQYQYQPSSSQPQRAQPSQSAASASAGRAAANPLRSGVTDQLPSSFAARSQSTTAAAGGGGASSSASSSVGRRTNFAGLGASSLR